LSNYIDQVRASDEVLNLPLVMENRN